MVLSADVLAAAVLTTSAIELGPFDRREVGKETAP
jgi:hypothetical protein